MTTLVEKAMIEKIYRELEKRYALQRAFLYEFIKHYWRQEKKEELDTNRHIKEICDKLEAVYR